MSGLLVALAVLVSARLVQADSWTESINGNLSTDPAHPTPLNLTLGSNLVTGNVTGTTNSQDWLAVTVPAGFVLSSDTLVSYTSTDSQGFTGFQTGSAFIGSTLSAGSYAGYAHFGTGATNNGPAATVVGTDLLPLMANPTISAGATGFTDPLPAGTYTFLIQQLGASTDYQFNFGVTAAPEPASLSIAALAAVVLTLRRRR